jgi:hypothetical protein
VPQGGNLSDSFPDSHINGLADTSKIVQNIRIGKTHYVYAVLLEECTPHSVIPLTLWLKMLRAVQLDCKLCRGTIKVQNVAAECDLAAKSNRIIAQVFVPQLPFLFRHIFAQLLCTGS